MAVHLSDHFTYKKLFKAVISPILMMVFTSLYSIVDGIFVSNIVGKTEFSALNLIYPVVFSISAIGFMLGAGGAALVSKTLGEGDNERANKIFSMVTIFTFIIGAICSVASALAVKPIAKLLGATDELLPHCVTYGRILLAANVAFMMQNLFQSFFIVAERPKLGFLVCVISGLTNMVFDAVFIAGAKLGLAGAAWATIMGQIVGALIPIIYFMAKNKSLLRLVPTKLEFKPILKSCTNGFSELLADISMSFVCMLYNAQLLKFAGEDGVAAYGVMQYLGFVFSAIFIGYCLGSSPLIGYHYGAQNHDELKNLLKKSLIVLTATGVVLSALSIGLARPLSSIFVSYDKSLLDMTTHGMRIYSVSFLMIGINMFASSFFTSLNNGLVSGILSFLRTLVLQILAVMLIPLAFGLDGIWSSAIVAEGLSIIACAVSLAVCRKKYNY